MAVFMTISPGSGAHANRGVMAWQSAEAGKGLFEAGGLGGAGGMIGAGFFDRFGLGLFGEAGAGEAAGEAVTFLDCCGAGFFEAGAFGGEIDDAF
jgi:hypothetical protein